MQDDLLKHQDEDTDIQPRSRVRKEQARHLIHAWQDRWEQSLSSRKPKIITQMTCQGFVVKFYWIYVETTLSRADFNKATAFQLQFILTSTSFHKTVSLFWV